MTFWEKYQELCTQHNTSPNAVAAILKFSNATCTKWKKGSVPSSESAVKIAEYFGVSTDYLLGNETMTKIPRLFEIMQERGISPAKLSADTGISAGNISDWKSGRSKPSSERLAILSKYLNVSTDYLLGNETKDYPLSNEALNVAKAYDKLSIENKAKVYKLICSLYDGQI